MEAAILVNLLGEMMPWQEEYLFDARSAPKIPAEPKADLRSNIRRRSDFLHRLTAPTCAHCTNLNLRSIYTLTRHNCMYEWLTSMLCTGMA